MFKITFKNEKLAEDYINGLISSGMNTVSDIKELNEKSFCVIGSDVFFLMAA